MLDLQPSAAMAPVVHNQSLVPSGDRVHQNAMTCCHDAQNGAAVAVRIAPSTKYGASHDAMPLKQMGRRDPCPPGVPALATRCVRQRNSASGHSAAFSGKIGLRLGTGPRYDACIHGVPAILDLQPTAARAPAVRNQWPAPGGHRVHQDAMTCCHGAQDGAALPVWIAVSQNTGPPMMRCP